MTINVAPITQTLFTESDVTVPFIKWKCNEGTGDILGAQSNLTIPDLPITQDGSAIWTAEGNAIAIDVATPGSEYIHQTALDSILAAMGGMAGSGTYILAFRRKAGSFPSAGNESLISYGTDAASATGRWTLRETVSLLDLHIRDVNNNTATLISRGFAIVRSSSRVVSVSSRLMSFCSTFCCCKMDLINATKL